MLKHYLVLKQSGVPLFSFSNAYSDPHYTGDAPIDTLDSSLIEKATLFSGLVSSIASLGEELGGQLQQIKLNNADLYTYKDKDKEIMGVTIAEPSENTEQIKQYEEITKGLTNRFVEKYKGKLNKWDGNVSVFDEFSNEIREYTTNGINELEVDPKQTCKPCVVTCCDDLGENIGVNL